MVSKETFIEIHGIPPGQVRNRCLKTFFSEDWQTALKVKRIFEERDYEEVRLHEVEIEIETLDEDGEAEPE